jgi:TolA-binding protein
VQVWGGTPYALLASLAAGQRWKSQQPPAAHGEPPDTGAGAPARLAAPPRPAASTPARQPPSSSPTAAPNPTAAPSAPNAARVANTPRGAARPDASTLLERASAARQAGDLPRAVAALERLVREFPRDERAGYAAFLLGRIQLDSLGDARAAVESLSFAVAHPGSGFFPEDADARRVEALARAGRQAECREARDRFLASYPGAARAASIRRACDGD